MVGETPRVLYTSQATRENLTDFYVQSVFIDF